MRKLIALILISLLIPIPSASANDKLATVKETTIVTGSTSVTSNIWKGNIPTRVGIRQYSNYLVEFPIQGLLAYETLGAKNSRGTGVTVEFEIWSAGGKKLGYDTIYSSSWNPVGPNTSVEFYLFDYPVGTHTLIIRTKYELSTTGLLTTYWEGKIQQAITVYDIDAQAKIDALAIAKAKAEADAKAKAETEAKAKAEAEKVIWQCALDTTKTLMTKFQAEDLCNKISIDKAVEESKAWEALALIERKKEQRLSIIESAKHMYENTRCTKLNSIKAYLDIYKFKCVKKGKVLVWKIQN